MAITEFQRIICRRIANARIASGESYVAGGTAPNTVVQAPRDTKEALANTWAADRAELAKDLEIEIRRERPTYVEAIVKQGSASVIMEWVCDSAFRFFPLIEHEDFGLTLHPFDLATNKVLALVGRVEVRDWIDIMHCSDNIQHLGYLAWAASGKDPGYSPAMILAEAKRSARYSQTEVAALAFDGPVPDAAALSAKWKSVLREADAIIENLPPAEVGRCVLSRAGELFHGPSQPNLTRCWFSTRGQFVARCPDSSASHRLGQS